MKENKNISEKPLVLDAFPYCGEKVQLEIRLNELNPVVDRFLIIESNRTQTGLEKPYYFEKQQKDFEQFNDKIIYVKLDDSKLDFVAEADWSQEFRVRKAIAKEGMEAVENSGVFLLADSILLISDVDEIPKKESILEFVNHPEAPVICFNHYFGSYYLNLISNFRDWGWYGTIGIRIGCFNLNGDTIQRLRNNKDKLPHTSHSGEGWHFSSLLTNGFNGLYSKWVNNIEPHDKTCLKDKKLLKKQFEKCLYEDMNFFFCDMPEKREILLEKLPIDNLPEYVKLNQEKFKKLIYE